MAKARKIPQRMCIGCRTMRNKKDLIRIVRSPEGEIHLDETGKKSGRGAYICPDIECLKKAIKSKSLQKTLAQQIPEDIFNKIEEKLNMFS